MNKEELNDWLLNSAITSDLGDLTQALVLSELDNVESDTALDEKVANLDWQRLLLAGSILANSKKRNAVEAALRIATSSLSLQTTPKVKDAGSLLLEKLSNYRSVDLAQRRGMVESSLNRRLGVTARLESLHRNLNNSILVEHSGEWLQVNPFQQEFWNEANKNAWVSASAPTASGKTFLVLQWLLDQITSTDIRIVVYLAPTRALVSEIEDNLMGLIASEKLTGLTLSVSCTRFRRHQVRCFMELEVCHGETEVYARVQA